MDSSDDENPAPPRKAVGVVGRGINELLKSALLVAANPLGAEDEEPEVLEAPGAAAGGGSGHIPRMRERVSTKKKDQEEFALKEMAMAAEEKKVAEMSFDPATLVLPCDRMEERAKYIPMRLTYEERKNLRLANASVNVSDYTSAVDLPFKNKAKRHHMQLQHTVAFLSGLIVATSYPNGQAVLSERNFVPHEEMLQNILEIARRYKITNPEKMRSEYGKLVYLMQDAASPEIKQLIGVDVHKTILTVYDLLQSCDGLEVLRDPLIATATNEILPGSPEKKSRHTIQSEIKRKEQAANSIVRKFASRKLSEETIRHCLYSIGDNNSFLNSNVKPIRDCIAALKHYFSPTRIEEGFSLSIDVGADGARLTHSHELQYNYVLQSLTLWAAIVEDMFRLWYLAEQDLLSESQPYELRNTGQGLQRVQASPRVYRAMHELLARTKMSLGTWIGSSVIHLGDNNVPNTLVFIDKYTQVSRILGPLLKTLENLEEACANDEGLKRYMLAYGGIEHAKKTILHDFFTHAFDGSGGENSFDAGSCIDGRLTSAWNWCSQLTTKPYYPLFRLTGFLSFDGQFDA